MCHANRVLDGNVFKYTYYELASLICLLYMSVECIYHCIIIALYISTLITKMCRFIRFKLLYPHYVCSSVFKEKGHLVYISFDSTKLEKSLTCVAVVQRYLVGKCVPPTWSALLCVLHWFLQHFSGPLSVPPKRLSDSPTLRFLWLLPCKTPVFFSDTSFWTALLSASQTSLACSCAFSAGKFVSITARASVACLMCGGILGDNVSQAPLIYDLSFH